MGLYQGVRLSIPNTFLGSAAFRSFHQNYIGQGHLVLLDAMDGHLSTLSSYNRSISIVQSSGTGKSRTVDKAAELRFAFPLNLRDTRDLVVKCEYL